MSNPWAQLVSDKEPDQEFKWNVHDPLHESTDTTFAWHDHGQFDAADAAGASAWASLGGELSGDEPTEDELPIVPVPRLEITARTVSDAIEQIQQQSTLAKVKVVVGNVTELLKTAKTDTEIGECALYFRKQSIK